MLVDSPGLMDSVIEDIKIINHIINFLKGNQEIEGLNMMIFTIPLTECKLDSSILSTLSTIQNLFGNEIIPKITFVFTQKNQLKQKSYDKKMEELKNLKIILKKNGFDVNLPDDVDEFIIFDYDNPDESCIEITKILKESNKFKFQLIESMSTIDYCSGNSLQALNYYNDEKKKQNNLKKQQELLEQDSKKLDKLKEEIENNSLKNNQNEEVEKDLPNQKALIPENNINNTEENSVKESQEQLKPEDKNLSNNNLALDENKIEKHENLKDNEQNKEKQIQINEELQEIKERHNLDKKTLDKIFKEFLEKLPEKENEEKNNKIPGIDRAFIQAKKV